MKSLITLTLAITVLASTAFAGDACCAKAKAAACEKNSAASCEKSKGECPVAKAALRKALTTHKGAQLAQR